MCFLVCIRHQDLFLNVPLPLTFSISFGVSGFRIRSSFITIGWHTTCRNSPTMPIEECYRPIFMAHLRVHLVPSIKDKLTLTPQKTNESLFLRHRAVSRNSFKRGFCCSFNVKRDSFSSLICPSGQTITLQLQYWGLLWVKYS